MYLGSRRDPVQVHTTYVGDGLGSVLRSAVDLQLGSSSTVALLQAEPGGTLLIFGGASDEVYLQVVQFSDVESPDRRWSGGHLRWHDRISVGDFIELTIAMAEDVMSRCGGPDAYAKIWGGIAFPADDLRKLRGGR